MRFPAMCFVIPCSVNKSSRLILGANFDELLQTRADTGNAWGWQAPGQLEIRKIPDNFPVKREFSPETG